MQMMNRISRENRPVFQECQPLRANSEENARCGSAVWGGRVFREWIENASTSLYMAHGYCLVWKPWLIAAHAISDLLIFAAYFAIPIAIWIYVRRRKDLDLKFLAVLFALFILLCGLTHLIQCITLWWPIYETQAWVKAATAAVSVATAVVIFPLIPLALAIPSPRQLQIVNQGPCQYEPRAAHAAKRDSGLLQHDALRAATDREPAREARHHQPQRRPPAGPDRRCAGNGQNRGGARAA
jgi:hypothetical protein